TPLNCLHAITASPSLYFCLFRRPPRHPLFPYTTLFRSWVSCACAAPSDMPAATASEPAIVVSFLLMVMILSPYRLLMTTVKALRSEEHTSELQSRENLVCRLLLEKKKYRPSAPADDRPT